MSIEKMSEKYLVGNGSALSLYEDYAKKIPFSVHCNFRSSSEIVSMREKTNITEYLFGIREEREKNNFSSLIRKISLPFATNSPHDMSDYELFSCLCNVLPLLAPDSMYDCIRLGISEIAEDDLLPSSETCNILWRKSRDNILTQKNGIGKTLSDFAVKNVFSKEDPAFPTNADLLKKASEKLNVTVLPEFCPDELFAHNFIEKNYISSLSHATKTNIDSIDSLKEAYRRALDTICFLGCKTAVHNIYSDEFFAVNPNRNILDDFFRMPEPKLRSTEYAVKSALFKTEMMRFFSAEYAKRKMVMRIRITVKKTHREIFDFKFGDNFEFCFGNTSLYSEINRVPVKTKFFTVNQIPDIIGENNDTPKIVMDFSELSLSEHHYLRCTQLDTKHLTSEIFAAIKPDEASYSSSSPDLSNFLPYNNFVRHIEPICDDIGILSLILHDMYRRALCRATSEYFSLRQNNITCSKEVINHLCRDIIC